MKTAPRRNSNPNVSSAARPDNPCGLFSPAIGRGCQFRHTARFSLTLLFALVLSASASVGPEGELRAILSAAMRENDAIRAERQAIAQENAALSAELINLRAAQSRTLTKLGELGAQAAQLASEAEANRESAVRTGEAYRAAMAEAATLHSRLWWWIWAACGLGLAIAGYVALRLRGLIPF